MESNKVKLPKEVAEAIESLRIHNSNENIVMYALNPKGNCGFTIAKSFKDGVIDFDTFLQALVNGYEVEQTPEDKVREYYKEANKLRAIKSDNNLLNMPSQEYVKYASRVETVIHVLDLLNIKIKGVNDHE